MTTTTTPWTQPSEIQNVNLVKKQGGSPGFITVSKHMCVGGDIREDQARNITARTGYQYRYACGYYHPKTEYRFSNGGGCGHDSQCPPYGTLTSLWDTTCNNGCSDCGAFCNTVNLSNGSKNEYISRDDNNKYTTTWQNRFALIPGGDLLDFRPGTSGKIRGALLFKHPRMSIDELKYFGVDAENRNRIQSVSAGETIVIKSWNCPHVQAVTLAVVFFKKDLSRIVIGSGVRNVGGNTYHDYKILSDVSRSATKNHSLEAMSYYTFAGTWWNNGGNEGPEPSSCSNMSLQVPLAPFWDDDTVMAIFVGPNTQGPRKTKVNDCRSILNNGSQTWFNGPHRVAYFTLSHASNPSSCSLTYLIEEFSETFFGCSQLRDVDWDLNSNGTANGGDSKWEKPESGSHIMKIVSSDYYQRECTDRISSSVLQIEQDSTVYLANCNDNVGDPRTVPDPLNPTALRTGLESYNGKHYIEKCMSYSMNVNPKDQHINQSRCCSPKISGPFLLDSRPDSVKTGINEKIYDTPYTKDSPFETKPQLSNFNDNFGYQLKYRMDCECDKNNCDLNPCYGCVTSTRETYDQCNTTQKCIENNCCTNPCTYNDGVPCPLDYEECRLTECFSKGCCEECSTQCSVNTFPEYQNCLNNQAPYSTYRCNEKGCCVAPCNECPDRYEDCIDNANCNSSGCCSKKQSDCFKSIKITDYTDCKSNNGPYYSDTLGGFCCQNGFCAYEEDPSSISCYDYFINTGLTWSGCLNIPTCANNHCYLLKPNIWTTQCANPASCPTNTIKQWINCINNQTCVGSDLKTNKCCNFPCRQGSDCFTQLSALRDFGEASPRNVGTWEECMDKCDKCRSNGCCDFLFNDNLDERGSSRSCIT